MRPGAEGNHTVRGLSDMINRTPPSDTHKPFEMNMNPDGAHSDFERAPSFVIPFSSAGH